MCEGIPLFGDNDKALYGKKTISHSTAAGDLGIKEDNFRKYEFHWWDGECPMDHYDAPAENILAAIDPKKATKHVLALVKKDLSTPEKLWKNWLEDMPSEWKRIQDLKPGKLKSYLFHAITGMTPAENTKALQKQQKKVDIFVERVKRVQWFKPHVSGSFGNSTYNNRPGLGR